MCIRRTTPRIPPIWASSNVYHITGVTSVEIGDVASPHWQRGHRLQDYITHVSRLVGTTVVPWPFQHISFQ
jgi:hypothetical protein